RPSRSARKAATKCRRSSASRRTSGALVTNKIEGGKPARRRKPRAVRVLRGVAAAPGVAIGRALLLDRGSTQIFRQDIPPERVEQEVRRLEQAVSQAREQLLVIKER